MSTGLVVLVILAVVLPLAVDLGNRLTGGPDQQHRDETRHPRDRRQDDRRAAPAR